MSSIPRVAWLALAGALALTAILLFPPFSKRNVDAKSIRKVSSAGSSEKRTRKNPIRALLESPKAKPLSSYEHLGDRALFKPTAQVAKDSDSDSNGPGGNLPDLKPFGLMELPPAGANGLFSATLFSGPATLQKSLGSWIYVGYSSEDGAPSAILQNQSDHQGRIVRAGESVEDATVLSVARQGIRLVKSGKMIALALSNGMETPAKDAALKASGPAAAPGSGPPPGNAPAQPNAGGPPANPVGAPPVTTARIAGGARRQFNGGPPSAAIEKR